MSNGAGRSLKERNLKDHFSDLPQPSEAEPIPTTLNDDYLKGLESYVDALSKHIINIQGEELALTRNFTDKLKSLKKNRSGEDEARNQYLRGISAIRERRKTFREMLFEAHSERRKLWESTELQKEEDELIRRKMSRLSALPEADSHKVIRKIAFIDIFFWVYLAFQIALIIIYGTATKYDASPSQMATVGGNYRIDNLYTMYAHIALMVFIGFGYLMSYMKKFGYSAIGYSFLTAAFSLQWAIIVIGFFDNAALDVDEDNQIPAWQKLSLGIDSLIQGLYGATTVLVAFGAILGRLTPLHHLIMATWMIGWYGLNHFLLDGLMKTIDVGGSMEIFLFGSAFGLAISWTTGRPSERKRDHEDKDSRYDSDIFSIIGTLFLWILWPSFNAAFAPDGTQMRVVINTVLSLCTGTIFSFLFSRVFRGGKFKIGDVQRGTLAGGIALGSCSSFLVGPGGAMATGAVAASLSTVAIVHLTPSLYRWIGLQDSMSVLGTYFIPALVGAIAGIVSAATSTNSMTIYGVDFNLVFPDRHKSQAAWHILGLITSIGVGLVAGASLGFIFFLVRRFIKEKEIFYSDETQWEVPSDFEYHIELEDEKN